MSKVHRKSFLAALWDRFCDALGMTRALGVLRASTGEIVQSVLPPMVIMDNDYAVSQMVKRFLNQPSTHEFLAEQKWDQFNFEVYEVPYFIHDGNSVDWEKHLIKQKTTIPIVNKRCDIIAVLAHQIATHNPDDLPRAFVLSENLKYIRKYISEYMLKGEPFSALGKDSSNFTKDFNWGLVMHA